MSKQVQYTWGRYIGYKDQEQECLKGGDGQIRNIFRLGSKE